MSETRRIAVWMFIGIGRLCFGGDVISSSVTCAVIAAGFDLGMALTLYQLQPGYPAGYPIPTRSHHKAYCPYVPRIEAQA